MKFVLKLIAGYILFGAIGSYVIFIVTQTGSHIISYFIPNFIAIVVFAFYCFAGLRFLQNPSKTIHQNLFVIVLLLQLILVDIGGFAFKNFYFPAYIFHMNLKDLNTSFFEFDYFKLEIRNGYFKSRDVAFLSVNILELGLLFLTLLCLNKIKKPARLKD